MFLNCVFFEVIDPEYEQNSLFSSYLGVFGDCTEKYNLKLKVNLFFCKNL